jgi:hypothetical protein
VEAADAIWRRNSEAQFPPFFHALDAALPRACLQIEQMAHFKSEGFFSDPIFDAKICRVSIGFVRSVSYG